MTDSEDTGIHYIPAACKDELPDVLGERTNDRDSLLGADDASETKSSSAGSEEKEESAAAAEDDDNNTPAESEADWGTQEKKDQILDGAAVFANKPAPANDWGDESSDFVVVAEKIAAAPEPAPEPVVHHHHHQPNTIHVASAFRFSPASKAANAKPSPFVALFTGDAASAAPTDAALTPTLAAFESSMSEANMWSSGLFLELLKDNPDRIKSSIVRAIHAAPDRAKAASVVLRASLANINDLNSINASVALDSSARTELLSDAEIRSIAAKESSDSMLVEHLSRAMRNGSRVPFIDTERSDHAVAAAVLNDVVKITSSIVKNAQPSAAFIKSSRPFRTRAVEAAFPTYSAAAVPATKFLSREEQIQRRLAAMTITEHTE
jgi:hypothetical protein